MYHYIMYKHVLCLMWARAQFVVYACHVTHIGMIQHHNRGICRASCAMHDDDDDDHAP